ncbi:MAG: dTDP-glucose 4,6-dehydratase [Nitrospiraceae bacterium]|nr:MAG: dTDP-glucose 4,6-dehydratase [Nitrospiraceae bacterium]
MRILVTGGAGFIASNFIRHMLSAYPGYHIVNIDSLTYAGNLENLREIESSDRYSFVKGDICNSDLLRGIAFDAIIHFAAESHVDRSILDAQPFLQTNIMGTYTLLEEARQRGCVFLHVSTDEVYGSTEEGFFHEDSPLRPNSPYAASKASSDLLVRAFGETHGVKAMITRCSNNYGPFQFPEKLIPLVILNGLSDKPVPVYGDGMNVRDWIHVVDHCRAVDAVFHRGRAGEVYNIGARNERTNIDLVKMILKEVAEVRGVDEGRLLDLITFVHDRKGHDRRYAIDPARLEGDTGWNPRVDFREGIKNTIEWYRANEAWWQRILSGEYREYYRTQYGERLRA